MLKKKQVQIDISTSVAIALRQEQIQCMATNIYFETRSVSLADAMSVSDVVLNRVASKNYPNSVCEVVYDSVLVNGSQQKTSANFHGIVMASQIILKIQKLGIEH